MKYIEGMKRLLTLTGWRQFFKVLTKKERIVFFIFLFLFFCSSFFLSVNFYFNNTEVQAAKGGIYIEGLVGSPRWIQPLYAPANDVDRDLVELIYSGLMKYDESGLIVPDLAKTYEIKKEGRIYEIYLKENVFWSDGKDLTADDVVFTVKAIQNPDSKTPLRVNWLGVEVEKISDLGIRFKLENPYYPFLETLTLKIIPKHLWQDIPPQNFPLAIYNLKPIGSGPYKLKNMVRDSRGKIVSLDLIRNRNYFDKEPNLSQISFYFFNSEEDLISAFNNGEIKGIAGISPKNLKLLKNIEFKNYQLSLPRYFAVFFNPKEAEILSDIKVRMALNYGTNKKEIIEKVLEGYGTIVNSPILPEIFDFNPPSKIYEFDKVRAEDLLENAGFVISGPEGKREKITKQELAFQFKSDLKLGSQGQEVKELQKCLAKDSEVYPEGMITGYFGEKTERAVIGFQEKYAADILEPWGFKKGTGLVAKTTRAKLNEICFKPPEETLPLKFSLMTVEQTSLIEVANLLKNQWQALGAEIEIKTFDITTLEQEIIKPRNYEMLLFGEVLGALLDPFPFWHSSQKEDPGLNLAAYENKKCDKLLKTARQTLNYNPPATLQEKTHSEDERKEVLESFQELLIQDAPCVFLYSPNYLYLISKEIKGINTKMIIDPSKRFSNIGDWYIKTKRAWR